MSVFSGTEPGTLLKPVSPLPGGKQFQPHEFVDHWLSQRGLTGDAQVQATYQEVKTVDSAAESKTAAVPLRDVVTPGFLSAYQSKTVFSSVAVSPRQGWVYPHRSHMTLDFTSLRVGGNPLPQALLRELQAGIAADYRAPGQPFTPQVEAQGTQISAQEKEQIRQLELLDANQVKLARLFAGLPTFDTVLKHLLVSRIQGKLAGQKLRASLPQNIDPDHWYVNHLAIDSSGGRSITSSQSFTHVMWDCLVRDASPDYSAGGVGFFTRPDAVDEADSVFAGPVDTQTLRAMQSAFYIAHPPTNADIKRQLRDELTLFRHNKNWGDSLDTSAPATAQAALAHLLARRFGYLFDLYKADRDFDASLTQSAQIAQRDEDRLLDIITTHPSMADRSRLTRAPIPHVYAVMLDMGSAIAQKWPAAMAIKAPDRASLFLYSLEEGIQRFPSFQDVVNTVRPRYEGQERTIQNLSSELSGHVFDVAANDLLQMQSAALDAVLNTPANETALVWDFAQKAEDALDLPMLSLAGPLAVRQQLLVENNRPPLYKTATSSQKTKYRKLEEEVFQAVFKLGRGIPTLSQFTRQKVKHYLQQTVHPGIEPDSDKTMVTLSYGQSANPRQSRIIQLTQLMLDNIRPEQYPNAMREVLTVYLADQQGQRIRHPASGYFITLTGGELARMVTSIDAGGSYQVLLRQEMNKPAYKTAWKNAYLANLKFKGYEAGLRGNEVFKAGVIDNTVNPPTSQKRVSLWLDAVLKSSTAQTRARVMGLRVRVYGLLLGGSVGVGGQHGTMAGALSIDGALIFSDQDGPDIKGTVGVYFPDSPDGNDFHEFSDLGDGIAGLLRQEQWQAYFRSRIATLDPEEIRRALGQQYGRPLIRGSLLSGDVLEELHQAHVNFQSAHADHRSSSNLDVRRQTTGKLVTVAIEIVIDLASMLLVPGFQLFKRAMKTLWWVTKTGSIPLNMETLQLVYLVANYEGRGVARGAAVLSRGQSSFLTLAARKKPGETLAGLPLEEAVYSRYAVTDSSVIRGLKADAQGFYRTTGGVARPVYVRQPDGTVFRVHDHTKLKAIEATLVDPVTGSSIRSSGVMRSTVARIDGEWRAVVFGQGGGKRKADMSPEPGSSQPKKPAPGPDAVSDSIRTPGNWDTQIMDLVPSIVTRLESWPQNRSLLIIDQLTAERSWSVRYTPGQVERIWPMANHPNASATDLILRRTAQNHYSLVLGDQVVEIPADGDCFFNALARGLNDGQVQGAFSMRGLRNAAADYIDRNPEVGNFVVPQASGVQTALFENAPVLKQFLDETALFDLTQIIQGSPNPHGVFQPTLKYLNLYADWSARTLLTNAPNTDVFPAEILKKIGLLLSSRTRSSARLTLSRTPYSAQERQTMRSYFEDILLGPIEDSHITQLLNNQYLLLSEDVNHILLEYGVSARQLTDHHPSNDLAFVKFDRATHGHLNDDQLDELLEGAYLVDKDDLKEVAKKLKQEHGKVVEDESELMDQFIYSTGVEDTIDLLRVSLARFPDFLRRLNIVLSSPVISGHLGGLLRVSEIAGWLRNPALSDTRLRIIAEDASTRYADVLRTESIDINWMRPFDDQNLQNILAQQRTLIDLMKFLGGGANVGVSDIARLFSVAGQTSSNTRIALLFNTADIWGSIQRIAPNDAKRMWVDLIGPHFSDDNIQQVLRHPGSLGSARSFLAALGASLGREEARANQIIQALFSVGPSRAQQYLYHFAFPNDRPGRSRLDLALHLEIEGDMPDWAWEYARSGVTRVSLKSLLERWHREP